MPFAFTCSVSHGGADTVATAVCYSDAHPEPVSDTYAGADPLTDTGAYLRLRLASRDRGGDGLPS